MSPNNLVDLQLKRVDVKISEIRQQMKGNGRPKKSSITALCDLTEQFIIAIENERKDREWEK